MAPLMLKEFSLWKPGTNTCINRNTAGVIVQSGGTWIFQESWVLGMALHLPSPHSPLAAASSALRSHLCTSERELWKGNSRAAQFILCAPHLKSHSEGNCADEGDHSDVTCWNHRGKVVCFDWKIENQNVFSLVQWIHQEEGKPRCDAVTKIPVCCLQTSY